jgi:hypothetical protein
MSRVHAATRRVRVVSDGAPGPAVFRIPLARTAGGDRQTLPAVVVSYVVLLEQQLHNLAALTATGIERPPL